jgi:hypothetical protein
MATTRKGTPADDPESYSARGGETAVATDCAACGAPLPAGNRYLCGACVEESGRRAQALLAELRGARKAGPAPEAEVAAADEDDPMACPTCGMRLDASGRCAGCVTTVRR